MVLTIILVRICHLEKPPSLQLGEMSYNTSQPEVLPTRPGPVCPANDRKNAESKTTPRRQTEQSPIEVVTELRSNIEREKVVEVGQ